MAEKKQKDSKKIRDLAFKIARITIIAVLIYLIYIVLAPFLTAFSTVVPGIDKMVELLVAVNVVLLILGDLTANTVYSCFLNAGRAIFTIAFMIFALGDGILSMSFQSFALKIDLTTVYGIVALLSLLGLARSVLQAINFMSERAESGLKP